MKPMLLNLWAWLVSHPEAVATTVLALLSSIVAATVVNGRAKGAPATGLERFVDLLAAKTRQGAKNAGWSWPMIGRSIFEAAIEASMPARETNAHEQSEPAAPDVSGSRSSEVSR